MIYGFVCLPQREISQSCSQSEAIFSSSSQKKEALDNFLSRHPKGHSYQFLRRSHISPVGKQKKTPPRWPTIIPPPQPAGHKLHHPNQVKLMAIRLNQRVRQPAVAVCLLRVRPAPSENSVSSAAAVSDIIN